MLDDVERQKQAEQLKALVAKHEAEALRRVGLRNEVEKRWIEDLQQYHGQPDLKDVPGSRLIINMTRPKTNAMSARLMDILFPTDDQNWGIQPTPVPSVTKAAHKATEAVKAMEAQAQEQGVEPMGLPDAKRIAGELQAIMDEAQERADLMQAEIADQMDECDYQAQCRDFIEDACKIGTGIMEGPVASQRMRRGWVKGEDGFELQADDDPRPAYYRVDPWAFYPDDVSNIADSDGNYLRYLWKPVKLRQFAKMDGVRVDEVRELLRNKPTTQAPSYLAEIRTLTGKSQDVGNDLYHVWKFSGALTAEDMRLIAEATGDEGTMQDMEAMDDPLEAVQAVIWFCEGRLLKASIYPLDSGEPMYSVFNIEKDEASIWGYGIPRIMRDPQKSLNAAWRMIMDNAAMSVSDQFLINKEAVEPADGDWTRKSGKVWFLKNGVPTTTRAMESFSTNSHINELAAIIEMAMKQIDEMTNLPQIAQGEQGVGVTQTAQGMAILMNAANVIFRRVVKNFDDDVTVPNIRRAYDWNMQFSTREEVKGDYEISARGSSVLLVREMQSQNLMIIAQLFGGHPVYGKYLKNIDVMREVFKAHMLAHEDFVVDDTKAEEAEAAEAEMLAAQAATGEDPAIVDRKLQIEEDRIEADASIASMKTDAERYVADMRFETEMMKLAEGNNMKLEEIEAKMQALREDRASKADLKRAELDQKERAIAAEIAVRSSEKDPLNKTQIANA